MKSLFVFGNHNTPNAIEDYVLFASKALRSISSNSSISRSIVSTSDLLVVQEDFNNSEAKYLTEFKKNSNSKKLVIIATENIMEDSFNDVYGLNKILEQRSFLEKIGADQLKSQSFPKFLFKKYLTRLRRDLSGFMNILDKIQHDHLAILKKRYQNFLKVAPFADQIWLMPGLSRLPYESLFGDRVKAFPFILSSSVARVPQLIHFKALLSGKITSHRRGLVNYLGLDEARSFLFRESWDQSFITSSFETPLSIRQELLNTVGIYLDLPVSEGSQIFSSMKASVSLEAGVPFFALTDASPGPFAPFVRTFTDLRSLKQALDEFSRDELVEMGAQFSSDAAKVFTPSAYPFLEELLK